MIFMIKGRDVLRRLEALRAQGNAATPTPLRPTRKTSGVSFQCRKPCHDIVDLLLRENRFAPVLRCHSRHPIGAMKCRHGRVGTHPGDVGHANAQLRRSQSRPDTRERRSHVAKVSTPGASWHRTQCPASRETKTSRPLAGSPTDAHPISRISPAPRSYTFRTSPSGIGRVLTRLPVAANTPFSTAGRTHNAPGSPCPPRSRQWARAPLPPLRHLQHARQAEVVEVGLGNAPVLDGVALAVSEPMLKITLPSPCARQVSGFTT